MQVMANTHPLDQSFELINNDGTFVRGDIAISDHGIVMQNSPRMYSVSCDELKEKEVIGRGASSYVARAEHEPSGTVLALKVINIFDTNKREQLIEEIRSLYNAECHSIVKFYGAFYREGKITIALEYMNGGSLANVIHQVGRIPEHCLASIAHQVLWGLAYLKMEKRIHRDIKPSNILINSDGLVKLTDFGVSKELKNSIAMCNTFVGTFKYMSPERIQNEPYSYAIDIWALGIVLYECATGKYPYDDRPGVAYIEMVQSLLDSPPPSLPENESFSPEMRDFVNCCVKKNPKDRLPADILLAHPWLRNNGAVDNHSAVANIKQWIDHLQ